MSAFPRRLLCIAILGLCAVGGAANVAQAAYQLEHACCPRTAPANSLTAPDAPCYGFLPLTCCHSAALPGGDHASLAAPVATACVDTIAIALPPSTPIDRVEATALAPRIAPTRRSVVRQL